VVTAGETVTAVPLVTAPTLLFTLPVPPLNTAVKVVEPPAVIVAAAGVKLAIAGAATTVTVTCFVAVVLAAFVTVKVYVVVVPGETFTGVPLVTAPTPLFTLPVPPLKTAVNVVELPDVIVAAPALKLVATGAGRIVSVAGVGADELLKVPCMCAVAVLSTAVVVTLNCALEDPAGTLTVAPTCAAALSLESVTLSPPVAAGPLNVTVPVEAVPPVTVVGATTMDVTVGGFTANVAVLATP
jgi:hypothetical protein